MEKYGLELDGDWNKESMHHQGRHPYKYHEYILLQIKRCDMTANGDVNIFKSEFGKVKKKIKDNPYVLRKVFWKGNNYEILFDDV